MNDECQKGYPHTHAGRRGRFLIRLFGKTESACIHIFFTFVHSMSLAQYHFTLLLERDYNLEITDLVYFPYTPTSACLAPPAIMKEVARHALPHYIIPSIATTPTAKPICS